MSVCSRSASFFIALPTLDPITASWQCNNCRCGCKSLAPAPCDAVAAAAARATDAYGPTQTVGVFFHPKARNHASCNQPIMQCAAALARATPAVGRPQGAPSQPARSGKLLHHRRVACRASSRTVRRCNLTRLPAARRPPPHHARPPPPRACPCADPPRPWRSAAGRQLGCGRGAQALCAAHQVRAQGSWAKCGGGWARPIGNAHTCALLAPAATS